MQTKMINYKEETLPCLSEWGNSRTIFFFYLLPLLEAGLGGSLIVFLARVWIFLPVIGTPSYISVGPLLQKKAELVYFFWIKLWLEEIDEFFKWREQFFQVSAYSLFHGLLHSLITLLFSDQCKLKLESLVGYWFFLFLLLGGCFLEHLVSFHLLMWSCVLFRKSWRWRDFLFWLRVCEDVYLLFYFSK